MNTKEILREVRQSKGPGQYQTTNYYNSLVPYSYEPGNTNGTYGINPTNVADDSFLRNLHIKNNNTIKGNYNYMPQKQNKIDDVKGHLVNDTRDNKSCNDVFEKDYFKLGYRTNDGVKNVQKHINFDTRVGIDSRHSRR